MRMSWGKNQGEEKPVQMSKTGTYMACSRNNREVTVTLMK